MTAKEYLSQAFRLDQLINSKLEQVANLRCLATKATASMSADRVSGTKEKSPMENAILKLVEVENEINKDIDKLVELKKDIINVVNSVNHPEYQLLLQLRYLNYKTWEEIAIKIGYELRYVHKLHNKALLLCEPVYKSVG